MWTYIYIYIYMYMYTHKLKESLFHLHQVEALDVPQCTPLVYHPERAGRLRTRPCAPRRRRR